jgi:DNA ligase-1
MVNPRTNKVDKIEADMNRYSSRYKSLSNLPIFGKYIKLCPTYNLISESMLKVYHAKLLKDGYEGSIVRCDGPYKNGRSFDLMKVKDFSDTEATIIDWVEGKGKRAGTIGKFIGKDEDGVEFGIPIMDKQSKLVRDFEEMKRWIGKTCTFTYFERTPAGSYRHPLFKTLRSYE